MTQHTELIARLRDYTRGDTDAMLDEAADAIEALEADNKLKDDLLTKCSDECFVLTNRKDELRAQLAAAQEQKDGAYLERNRLVALLSKVFPSGKATTAIDGWDVSWHGCVYIDLPTGQASWHYHDSQAYLFDHLPLYQGWWDGHTTEEKYKRIAAIPQQPAQQAQPERAPLSDDEIRTAYESVYQHRAVMGHGSFSFARAIEAAHGIKQGGQHE